LIPRFIYQFSIFGCSSLLGGGQSDTKIYDLIFTYYYQVYFE